MKIEQLDSLHRTPGHVARLRVSPAPGVATTCHVARYRLDDTRVSIHRLAPAQPVGEWCERHDVIEAISGGFFAKPDNVPLGEFRPTSGSNGHRPFQSPWNRHRGALHLSANAAVIDRLDRLTVGTDDALLQAGPALVLNGTNALDAEDPEGFSQTAEEFDQDLTEGRLPRLAIAQTRDEWLAIAVDGRAEDDAGLSLWELADLLIALGARCALNLDGGSSAALVSGGQVRNTPRDDEGVVLPAAGPTTSAIVFRTHSS